MRKFFSVLFFAFIGFVALVSPAYAMTYDNNFPDYIPYAGGAYIEVNVTTFQKCACVFPIDTQKNTFSFIGSSNTDIVNITRSTINGYLYTSSGTRYDCRASSLSSIEYRDNGYPYEWHELNITKILNTNVVFEDLKGLDRQNDNPYFSTYEKVCLTFCFICVLLLLIRLIVLPFRKGVRA